jgi:hypothetical protein
MGCGYSRSRGYAPDYSNDDAHGSFAILFMIFLFSAYLFGKVVGFEPAPYNTPVQPNRQNNQEKGSEDPAGKNKVE